MVGRAGGQGEARRDEEAEGGEWETGEEGTNKEDGERHLLGFHWRRMLEGRRIFPLLVIN